jgi:hypothetical protein
MCVSRCCVAAADVLLELPCKWSATARDPRRGCRQLLRRCLGEDDPAILMVLPGLARCVPSPRAGYSRKAGCTHCRRRSPAQVLLALLAAAPIMHKWCHDPVADQQASTYHNMPISRFGGRERITVCCSTEACRKWRQWHSPTPLTPTSAPPCSIRLSDCYLFTLASCYVPSLRSAVGANPTFFVCAARRVVLFVGCLPYTKNDLFVCCYMIGSRPCSAKEVARSVSPKTPIHRWRSSGLDPYATRRGGKRAPCHQMDLAP